MITVKALDLAAWDGNLFVEFSVDGQANKRYILEVDARLVDQERGVMSVFVSGDYGDGTCYVCLPGESFAYGDRAVLPEAQVQPWSPRVKVQR